jgi:hypothetical protein
MYNKNKKRKMKLLSVDVGIKNLCFCLFDIYDGINIKILLWETIDVSQSGEGKTCTVCNKVAKFSKENDYYCLKHSKTTNYHVQTAELKRGYLNKQKIQSLIDIANKYNIPFEKPIKKTELLTLVHDYVQKTCFSPIEKTDATKVDLAIVSRNMHTKLNELLKHHQDIDKVIVENQIGPIANRMKAIQGILSMYFIVKYNGKIHIKTVSSSNKLKNDHNSNSSDNSGNVDEITKYSERKKLSIKRCIEMISNDADLHVWVDFFKKHKKKDDLSDAFLQGIWYIRIKK